jgi:DNA polymerase-2
VYHDSEKSLLAAFTGDIMRLDPDVLTGWNFLDFDFRVLAERAEKCRVPFSLGRSGEAAKFFPGDSVPGGDEGEAWGYRRRSAAALVPGRQVIDALRIVRLGVWGGGLGEFPSFRDFTLENAAQAVLGEGKSVALTGDEKIAELDRLYAEEPETLARYCAKDAELVLRILGKTGLFRLTLERATATGVFLDKAWTSVAAFERIYGMELARRNIAPPVPVQAAVSGAAGGTILESESGLFRNVAVFDFRSLYPTIIRTFNIDPLAHARAGNGGAGLIAAPNGAVFSREPGILPALIADYFAARREALKNGDGTAASVYKILMNSFYGVLGTPACRYGRTELAGAITSFAKKWLHLSRDWFREQGLRVLYGDTDSLFVETPLDDGAAFREFSECCRGLAERLNLFLAERIRAEYGLESFLELRFEKACRRLIIPPLRNARGMDAQGTETRGRAKGYGILALGEDGAVTTEVKGMEAIRSDATPLARRLQVELLDMVFRGCDAPAFTAKVRETLRLLRSGAFDTELVYRRRLSRSPEAYTASTPPWVKAARMLGWKGRRGAVEYVWTVNGPEPLSLLKSPPDYGHYTDSQILPVAISIAAAAGWNEEIYPEKGRRREAGESGQMELAW